MSSRTRSGAALAAALVLLLAVALRLIGAPLARGPDGFRPRLDGDGDVLYHAAQARHLAATGQVRWFDPALDPPHGARVLWPPLLEALVVGAAWMGAAGRPTPAQVDAAAALVPVGLGLLATAAGGALALLLLGPGHGLLAALILALAPGAVFASLVGRTDQPGLELLALLLALLALAWAARGPTAPARALRAIPLGVALAASFWGWQGSAVLLLLLSAGAAAEHLLVPAADPTGPRLAVPLAAGSLAAAALLAGSIALLGPPGALWSGAIEGVSGLGVASCAATALGAGLLAGAGRRPRPGSRRLLEVAAAAALAAGSLLVVPTLRVGLLHGLRPVALSAPWYASIAEFQPLFLGELASPLEELGAVLISLGLLPALAIAGASGLPRLAREQPERRPGLVLLGTAAALLVGLWLARRRFDRYALVPIAVLAAAGARALAVRLTAGRASRRLLPAATAILLLAAAPTAIALAGLAEESDPGLAPVLRVAVRLGGAVASGAARPGVILCGWDRGHHARLASGLPALATPFGTDAGPEALSDWARLLLARAGEEPEGLLAARQIRWLLLDGLEEPLLLAHRLAPVGPPPVVVDRERGLLRGTPAGAALAAVGLYQRDGNGLAGIPAVTGFRLVDEEPSPGEPARPVRLFERVAGARLSVTGAPPAARIEATVALWLPGGRRTALTLHAEADPQGRAALRLPYASGRNGAVVAAPWTVGVGEARRTLEVPEAAVLDGARLELPLLASGRDRRR